MVQVAGARDDSDIVGQCENAGINAGGAVQTIYGAPPRDTFPASITTCLTGIAVAEPDTLEVVDSCTGLLIELWRQPLAP